MGEFSCCKPGSKDPKKQAPYTLERYINFNPVYDKTKAIDWQVL